MYHVLGMIFDFFYFMIRSRTLYPVLYPQPLLYLVVFHELSIRQLPFHSNDRVGGTDTDLELEHNKFSCLLGTRGNHEYYPLTINIHYMVCNKNDCEMLA